MNFRSKQRKTKKSKNVALNSNDKPPNVYFVTRWEILHSEIAEKEKRRSYFLTERFSTAIMCLIQRQLWILKQELSGLNFCWDCKMDIYREIQKTQKEIALLKIVTSDLSSHYVREKESYIQGLRNNH